MTTVKRNGVIDIYRFLFALVIMTGHSVNLGMKPPFPFAGVGIFVEFFYLLTGYYTFLHFSEKTNCQLESSDWMRESLSYSIKKFIPFFPYLMVSVAARYFYEGWIVLQSGGYYQAFRVLAYAPFEMFLTNYFFAGIPQKVGALYFLAAMIVVLPVFCILCMCRNNTVNLGIALYSVLFYYHDVDWAITASYPQVLARAFCGMCMGIIIRYAVVCFSDVPFFKMHSSFTIIVGNILLLFSMILSGINFDNRRIQLLSIFFGVMALLFANNWKKVCSSKFTDYLSKCSVVVYIFHWTIGVILNGVLHGHEMAWKMVAYYVVTAFVSAGFIWIVERRKSVIVSSR